MFTNWLSSCQIPSHSHVWKPNLASIVKYAQGVYFYSTCCSWNTFNTIPLFIHATTYTLIITWWSPIWPFHSFFLPISIGSSLTICQVAWWDGSHRWTNRWRRLSSVPGRQGSRSPKCWRATGDRPGKRLWAPWIWKSLWGGIPDDDTYNLT